MVMPSPVAMSQPTGWATATIVPISMRTRSTFRPAEAEHAERRELVRPLRAGCGL